MYFVFLGSLDNSKSVGTNNLIKEFAQIVTRPEDILLKYGLIEELTERKEDIEKKDIKPDIPNEYLDIYKLITNNPIDINDIVKRGNIDLKTAMSKLTILELEGKIKKVAGNRYIKGDD